MSNDKDFTTTLAKLKTRAYWRVELYPNEFNPKAIPNLADCKQIVAESAVEFRGWDVPHVPVSKDEKQDLYIKDNNRAEAWINWHLFKEVWRMYQSGKFTFLFGLTSQWYDEYNGFSPNPLPNLQPGKVVDVIDTIYSLTEVMYFAHHLAGKLPEVEGWVIKMGLYNINGNILQLLDPSRVPLRLTYESRSEEVMVLDIELESNQLKDTKLCQEIAGDAAKSVFANFQWQAADVLIQGEQDKLVNKRFL